MLAESNLPEQNNQNGTHWASWPQASTGQPHAFHLYLCQKLLSPVITVRSVHLPPHPPPIMHSINTAEAPMWVTHIDNRANSPWLSLLGKKKKKEAQPLLGTLTRPSQVKSAGDWHHRGEKEDLNCFSHDVGLSKSWEPLTKLKEKEEATIQQGTFYCCKTTLANN